MEAYKIYCAGEFVSSGQVLEVKNKFTQQTMATTWLADRNLIDKAVHGAEQAKAACKALSAHEKYQALKYISETVLAQRQRLADVLCAESGKPIRYALAEVERAAQTFLVAAEEGKRLPAEHLSLDWTPSGKNKTGTVAYFPVGIVGGIAPFNFPMNLAVHKLAPAIAAGCPIVLKPASSTPLSTLELAKIIAAAGLPKGAVSILPMDRETGNLLVTDERIALLSFTGSPAVGWDLKKQCGKKKIVLELGGNAGVIISDTADLDTAVRQSLVGGFSYSGQICIHAQRFFVHPQLFDAFSKAFVAGAKALKYGDPLEASTDVSVVIDATHAVRIHNWIQEALKEGATLLCGGKRTGNFVEPTVLTNTHSGMKVCAEEVFGPVVCLEMYDGTIEDAVKRVNAGRFGLQCGVFTNRVDELDYAFMHLDVGGVIHNEMPTLRFDHMPYGGVKESGLGREGVKYALLDMLEPKILVK